MTREDSSAQKALRILRFMIEGNNEYSVRQISHELHIPKSTVHRLLIDLQAVGFIVQTAESYQYSLAMESYRLASLVMQKMDYMEVARQLAKELAEESGETVLFGLYNRTHRQMMVAIMEQSVNPLRYVVDVGVLMPVYVGASGKAIMAWLPDEEIEQIIKQAEKAGVVLKSEQLKQELMEIRRQGYIVTSGERIGGAIGIAAPVFGSGKQLLGDLVITVPEYRCDRQKEAALAKLVMEKAEHLSRLMVAHK